MLYVISEPQNNNLIEPKQKAQMIKTAHKNLGGKFAVSIDEYAKAKGIDREEALEYDLNNDGKITIGEEISAICSQKLFNREINPSIVLYAIYDSFGLRQLDSDIKENLDILG